MFDPNIPVTHFIKQKVYQVPANEMLSDAAKLMRDQHINHLPVCDGDKVIGIVTDFDLMRLEHSFTIFDTRESRAYNQKIFDRLVVGDVMSDKVATIPATTTAREAADRFRNQDYHSLVVVAEDEQTLVGIVTVMDLLHYAYDSVE